MVVEKIFNTQPLFKNFVFIFTWKKAIKNLCNMYQYRKFLTSVASICSVEQASRNLLAFKPSNAFVPSLVEIV